MRLVPKRPAQEAVAFHGQQTQETVLIGGLAVTIEAQATVV